MDQNLTNLAKAIRDVCQRIKNINTEVNGNGQGFQVMTSIGYSIATGGANPGGISDAQYALNLLAFLNTISGCYYGTVQQGGTGGTGAINYNFDNALSPLWAGQ
jgi:hypothetical protein